MKTPNNGFSVVGDKFETINTADGEKALNVIPRRIPCTNSLAGKAVLELQNVQADNAREEMMLLLRALAPLENDFGFASDTIEQAKEVLTLLSLTSKAVRRYAQLSLGLDQEK